MSLADYADEYTGGIYLVGAESERHYLDLSRGDAVFHQSDLHHGVRVDWGTRWSWILWYRDSRRCEDKSEAWFADCAQAGNAICESFHANRGDADHRIEWMTRAADHGLAVAMLKLGRAFLKHLPSPLALDRDAAAALFRRGVDAAKDPNCAFDLAQLLVANETAGAENDVRDLLELAAAKGHTYAAFNLGLAHLFGHAHLPYNPAAAADWFAHSGLPEGLRLASIHRAFAGDADGARAAMDQALTLGADKPWRSVARARTGSGGAGGSPLYSAWPDRCAGLDDDDDDDG